MLQVTPSTEPIKDIVEPLTDAQIDRIVAEPVEIKR